MGAVDIPVEQHEMELRGTLPSGAQEWDCPTCGRQFVVRWSPDFQRMVLAEGDPDAAHVGSTADVRLVGTDVPARPSAEAERAWQRWLDDHGLT
jgi:hypothetical protein